MGGGIMGVSFKMSLFDVSQHKDYLKQIFKNLLRGLGQKPKFVPVFLEGFP